MCQYCIYSFARIFLFLLKKCVNIPNYLKVNKYVNQKYYSRNCNNFMNTKMKINLLVKYFTRMKMNDFKII